jgi:hypothetical protein
MELEVVLRRIEESILGNKTDDLRFLDAYPVPLRLPTDCFERPMDRGHAVVGEVHRYLGPVPLSYLETERLDLR